MSIRKNKKLLLALAVSACLGAGGIQAAERDAAADSLTGVNEARAAVTSSNRESREAALLELAQRIEGHVLNGYVQNATERSQMLTELVTTLKQAEAASDGRYRYSHKIVDASVFLGDQAGVMAYFEEALSKPLTPTKEYTLTIDHADALAKFGLDAEAEAEFKKAISLRASVDGFEAYNRYAHFLAGSGREEDALSLLEELTTETWAMYPSLTFFKQELIYALGQDSTEIDEQVDQLRQKYSEGLGLVVLPKTPLAFKEQAPNPFGLNEVSAFSHWLNSDDSRGTNANTWIEVEPGFWTAAWVLNAAEVVYNEAGGEGATARRAVAWAIRNRAWIDMNGADNYHGAESDNNVWTSCRNPTPVGPDGGTYAKRYSCVVHGDTYVVGDSHSQMNDGHQDYLSLKWSGVFDVVVDAINGWSSDPTSSPAYNPFGIWTTGNPNGAQEWLGGNYCAANPTAKRRAGNVGGNNSDPGDYCPNSGLQSGTGGDNWFWARKP